MSESYFLYQEHPRKKDFCYPSYLQDYYSNPYEQSNINISHQETPTPGQQDERTIFDENLSQEFEQIGYENNMNYIDHQYQTLPYMHSHSLQQQQQQPQQQQQLLLLQQQQPISSNFSLNQFQKYTLFGMMKQDQYNIENEQINEIQKDSDQTTDAQIQSYKDDSLSLKEKVKIQSQSSSLNSFLLNIYEGKDIAEDDLIQLDDAERAIFYSVKNSLSSQYDIFTPQPPLNDQQKKEYLALQNQQPQYLLHLDEDFQGIRNQLTSSQLSNEASDQSQSSSPSVYADSFPSNSKSSSKKQLTQKKKKNSTSGAAQSQASQQQSKKRVKRVEEMQKMVFKKSFKYVETQYFRERIKKTRISSKDKDYKKFYEFFFSTVSQENKIPLKNFYHPQKQIKKGEKTREDTPGQKSFNQAYISLMLKSKSFREKVEYYIENIIQSQIYQERETKIGKFILNMKKKYIAVSKDVSKNKKNQGCKGTNFEQTNPQKTPNSCNQVQNTFQSDEEIARINQESQIKLIVEKLENYIQTNSKLKLPWTDCQINQAIDLARQTITTINNQ